MLPEDFKLAMDIAYRNGALAMQRSIAYRLLDERYEDLAQQILAIKAECISIPIIKTSIETRLQDVRKEVHEPQKSVKLDASTIAIEGLELSTRTITCLRKTGINTIEDLTEKTRKDLLAMRNFGRRSLNEIVDVLDNMGLTLRSDNE